MIRRYVLVTLAVVVSVLAVASSTASPSATSILQRQSEPSVREERAVPVDASQERWALEWLSSPKPVCTPEDEPESWMTCPCERVAIGEQGHLSLIRRRANGAVEQLILDPFFETGLTEPGMFALQRWPTRTSDIGVPSTEVGRLVRSRPLVELMSFGDYDHDGRATEFTLWIGNAACGHGQAVLVGVSRRNPKLHVFGTVSHPDVPLVLRPRDWESLRRSGGDATVVDFACGDHGSDQQTEVHLVTRPDGIHAERLTYACEGPRFERGRLLSRGDLQ